MEVSRGVDAGTTLGRFDSVFHHSEDGEEVGLWGAVAPAEVGGGDEFLGVRGEVAEEGVAAGGIELAEDVVQ
jgi:hypothetical protein